MLPKIKNIEPCSFKKRKHDSLSPVSGKTEMKFYLRKMYMIIT